MSKLRTCLGVVGAAVALLGAAGTLSAQEQLTDRSGAITLQATLAPYVNVLNEAGATFDLTAHLPGGAQPGTAFARPGGLVVGVQANTAYRLSVTGIDAASKVTLRNADDVPLVVTVSCGMADQAVPPSWTPFACPSSGSIAPVFDTATSVNLTRYVQLSGAAAGSDTEMKPAGVYTGVVYLQVDAL